MAKIDEDRLRRIDDLVRRIQQIADQDIRGSAEQLMQAILELHGAGLERLLEMVFESGVQGEALIRRFAGDMLVANLLVLHGLHPDDLETRVRHALAKLNGKTELVSVFDGRIHVRLFSGNSKESVEAALRDAIPDAGDIVVEDSMPQNGFVPLTALFPFDAGVGLSKG